MPVPPLIDPEELAALLGGPRPPTLLDVRWQAATGPQRDAYLAAHLPGAVFVDLDADLAAPPGAGGRHPLPAPQAFQAAARRLGVRGDRSVVVYDAGDATSAARAWWLLGFHGHPDVRVLDGGLAAWTAAGLPVTSGEVRPEPGGFVARPGGRPLLDAAGAARTARDGVLLDARAPARYRGEEEPYDPVAGHIPGARCAPTVDNLAADGRLAPPGQLRRRFEGLGVREGIPVGAYCGSGVTAAHQVLALEAAGFPAALYVGSWSDWVADPARPVATGPDPGGTAAPSGRLHHLPAGALSADTAQTPGMRRLAAVSGATVGAQAIWLGETHVAPATRSGPHHHGHSETGIYVVSGNPVFVFLGDGGEEVRLETRPGDYVFVPPFVPHVEENPSPDQEAVVVIARSTQEAIVVNLDSLRPGSTP
jgi:thiosulfate/3-mercaptopyruvate sulfurtransferase